MEDLQDVFWGLQVSPKSTFTAIPQFPLHLTNACIAYDEKSNDKKSGLLQLCVNDQWFTLCCLKRGQNDMHQLDLFFNAETMIQFRVQGDVTVDLTGYYVSYPAEEGMLDEDERMQIASGVDLDDSEEDDSDFDEDEDSEEDDGFIVPDDASLGEESPTEEAEPSAEYLEDVKKMAKAAKRKREQIGPVDTDSEDESGEEAAVVQKPQQHKKKHKHHEKGGNDKKKNNNNNNNQKNKGKHHHHNNNANTNNSPGGNQQKQQSPGQGKKNKKNKNKKARTE